MNWPLIVLETGVVSVLIFPGSDWRAFQLGPARVCGEMERREVSYHFVLREIFVGVLESGIGGVIGKLGSFCA